MNYFTKNRIKNIFIVFLLISNLATVGTIMYHRWAFSHKFEHQSKERQIEKFVNEELGFSADQKSRFQTDKQSFLKHKDSLFENLENYRINVWNEYASPTTDKEKLDSLAIEISENFLLLNKASNEHYLNLLKICDNSQKTKVREKYKKMIEEEEKEEKEEKEEHCNK
jgi:hypothetical protein